MADRPTDNEPAESLARRLRTDIGKDLLAPNPQGKGQVGFLRDWHYSSPRGIVAKPAGRLLADYFTSLLVLSADFKFKPAFETDYFLYREEPRWSLSLIAPDEWNRAGKRENFVGTCRLHADSTWSISPAENLSKQGPVADAVTQFFDGFVEKLRSRTPLEDELPIYEANLPYYQRLFAAALSRSLKASMTQGGQLSRESVSWLEALPADGSGYLLTGAGD
jgi:hypothetical protein